MEAPRRGSVLSPDNVSRILDFGKLGGPEHAPDSGSLLQAIADALLSCIRDGSAKSQWNACHALGLVFENGTASAETISDTWGADAVSALLALIECSNNFKTRIHAAVAIAGTFKGFVQPACACLDASMLEHVSTLKNAFAF